MKRITFYLDFVSPYAFLAFERLPDVLAGISHSVTYQPVLLGALLHHHGHAGPAAIAPKRAWTYRHAEWLGQSMGVALRVPATHPFNPLPLLRMAVACGRDGACNRFVAGALFHHVWLGGADALDVARLDALRLQLPVHEAPDSPAVKDRLRANTDEAARLGAFGAPTFAVDDKLFWGLDSLPMLRAYLTGDPWFEGSRWEDLPSISNCMPSAKP